MALTAQQLALRLAKHIGVVSLDPNDPSNLTPVFNRGLQPGDVEELAACINAALQEVWSTAPTAASHCRQSAALPAPVATTLQLTQGSTAIADFPDYAVWMPGCTVVIEGGREHHEVVNATTLRDPYHGVTGSVNAMVYADAVALAPEVTALIEPLECSRIGKVPDRLRLVLSYEEYRRRGEAALRHVGIPEVAYLESQFVFSTGLHTVRLRVSPLPVEPVLLSFGVKLNVPVVSVSEVSTLPDPERHFPLPGGWDESVLLPLALRRLATHPDFLTLNTAVRLEIAEQARVAHRIMRSTAPNRSGEVLHPVFR